MTQPAAPANHTSLPQTPPQSTTPRGHGLRMLATSLGVTALALPLAFMVTVLLHPFWSWLETTTGLESMGRHGPASWCYGTIWGLIVLAVFLHVGLRRARTLFAPAKNCPGKRLS